MRLTNQQINTAIKQRRLGFTWAGLAQRYGVTEAELTAAVAEYRRAKLRAKNRGNVIARRRARAARNRAIGDLMAAGVSPSSIAQQCRLSVEYVMRLGRQHRPRTRAEQ